MIEQIKFLRFIPEPREPTREVVDKITKLAYEIDFQQYQKFKQEHIKYTEIYEDILLGNIEPSSEFLEKNFPFYKKNFFIPITEEHRKRHTYIVGTIGSGKSELIKSLIWHYLNHYSQSAIVLIAPEDDICEQVAKFNINYTNDRLVYIKPSLKNHTFFPCINPFDIPNKSALTAVEAEIYSLSFLSVFIEALEGIGAETSAIMEVFLKSIIPVLMKYENSSILDLLRFFESPTTAQEYIEYARNIFPDDLEIANRLEKFTQGNEQTRRAIYTRLQSIFGLTIMRELFIGKSTINIKELLLQNKLIVVNLPKGDYLNEAKIIGKIIIAMIKNVALQKHKDFYCHLFIDEFHNFATKSIKESLEELRKFNLFLTLAQQQVGQGLSDELEKSILGNTGVKIIAPNGYDSLNKISKEIGIERKELQDKLSQEVFACWKTSLNGTSKKASFFRPPKTTLKHKKSMSDEQWKQIETEQIQKYYRSATQQSQDKQPENNPIIDDIHAHLN